MPSAIIRMDPRVFSGAEDAQLVLECMPTEDEQLLLNEFLGSGKSVDMLSVPEQFALSLARTHRAGMRLKTFQARHVAAEKQQEAKQVRPDQAVVSPIGFVSRA